MVHAGNLAALGTFGQGALLDIPAPENLPEIIRAVFSRSASVHVVLILSFLNEFFY
jgi:hypothetical protein